MESGNTSAFGGNTSTRGGNASVDKETEETSLPVWMAPRLTVWEPSAMANVSIEVPQGAEAQEVEMVMTHLDSVDAMSSLNDELMQLAISVGVKLDWEVVAISSPVLRIVPSGNTTTQHESSAAGVIVAIVMPILVLLAVYGACERLQRRASSTRQEQARQKKELQLERRRNRIERRRQRQRRKEERELRLGLGDSGGDGEQSAEDLLEEASLPSTDSDEELLSQVPSEEPADEIISPLTEAAIVIQQAARLKQFERRQAQRMLQAAQLVQAVMRRRMATPEWRERAELLKQREERVKATRARFVLRLLNRRLANGFSAWIEMRDARDYARRRLRECANRFQGGELAMTFYGWRDSLHASMSHVETARRALAKTVERRKSMITMAEQLAEQLELMALQMEPVANRLDAKRREVISLTAELADCEKNVQRARGESTPMAIPAEAATQLPPVGRRGSAAFVDLIASAARRRRSSIGGRILPPLPAAAVSHASISASPAAPAPRGDALDQSSALGLSSSVASVTRFSWCASGSTSEPTLRTVAAAAESWRSLNIRS